MSKLTFPHPPLDRESCFALALYEQYKKKLSGDYSSERMAVLLFVDDTF